MTTDYEHGPGCTLGDAGSPCEDCRRQYLPAAEPDPLPDLSVLRDARLQLEAAARRLRKVEEYMLRSQLNEARGISPQLWDKETRQQLGEARALVHAATARL